MKSTLIGIAFLAAGGVAFALGNVTAARSADANCGTANSPSASFAKESRTVALAEGASQPLQGTLISASANGDRPCDLIVFQNGQSQLLQVSPSGTPLKLAVSGTVSASGNPLGYTCSIVLRYTVP
jgi:hypothetical protein